MSSVTVANFQLIVRAISAEKIKGFPKLVGGDLHRLNARISENHMTIPALADVKIAIIGLGYVGLPLAVSLAKHFPTVGFDIDAKRVKELNQRIDQTLEVTESEFAEVGHIHFTVDSRDLRDANFFIVTVPTPIDKALRPDLTALQNAGITVAKALKQNNVVVFESTVYPGATEDFCVPILEKHSGLKFNLEFFVGYSPERINPGDPTHRISDVVKVTSGSTPESAALVNAVYARVATAGTHLVSSIRVAEASKVIENVQRDVNIALVNELAQLFRHLGLETREILAASGTKWNFHKYMPGLVGGHCIGVDPYYLTHTAQSVGFHPEMILAGRKINDGMAKWIAIDVVQTMSSHKLKVSQSRVLVLGFTFKEDCPDIRNTKVSDLVTELGSFVERVCVYDPLADCEEARREYGIDVVSNLPSGPFEAIVIAVRHREILDLAPDLLRSKLVPGGVLYDLKQVLPVQDSDARL